MIEYKNDIGKAYFSEPLKYEKSMGLLPPLFSGDVCADCTDGWCGGDCGGDCVAGACSDCDCACYDDCD